MPRAQPSASAAVHPRGRGEHCCPGIVRSKWHGSSPRSRGTLAALATPVYVPRFIPAVAGNTYRSIAEAHSWSVHPRGRGEHATAPKTRPIPLGSSPRSRGTLTALPEIHLRDRFIPAVAGNTVIGIIFNIVLAVHPRGRGEHRPSALRVRCFFGSSPRSRGTRMRA